MQILNDKLTMVWYPNESGNDLKRARDEIGKVIEDVTGKKVEHKLTTDYAIAIETIANGNAHLAFMGAQGYIEAKNKNDKVSSLLLYQVGNQVQSTMRFTIAG